MYTLDFYISIEMNTSKYKNVKTFCHSINILMSNTFSKQFVFLYKLFLSEPLDDYMYVYILF